MKTYDSWEEVPNGAIVLESSALFPMYMVKLGHGIAAVNSADNNLTEGWDLYTHDWVPEPPFTKVEL